MKLPCMKLNDIKKCYALVPLMSIAQGVGLVKKPTLVANAFEATTAVIPAYAGIQSRAE